MPQLEIYKKAAGDRLGKIIRYLKLSQKEFAKKYGATDSSVTAYLQGETWIPWRISIALKQQHKISLDWIYYGDDGGQTRALTDDLERAATEPLRIVKMAPKRRKSA